MDNQAGAGGDVARFVRLFTANERRIRAFLYGLLVNRDAVDEVMQNVSVVLWEKFSALQDDDGFLKWSYVVARYEAQMHRRKLARNRFVFDDDLLAQLASEYASEEDFQADDQMLHYLDDCMTKLDDSERELIVTAYGTNQSLTSVADRLDVTANSLYKTVARLRRRLQRCIDHKCQPVTPALGNE
ncbi:RNA polymerase sigma-70 factor, ECF subfamily [Neorhodopirellula lusitana]|uniref:RNA polymerase sigma-70 factor, ECF subfamily n=1 Tax=Neorhodopirellula lusitana TaxID=445327 RepID=A0ABY1PVS9_9BACT|nr:sigma-70 family RNA polymerase sigma factor [Neorhodopirellula lusitana]SMP50550.1 RNA polymerase sigma-70 factor, ECF subfamily [Neorhodopirellula lusitana]